MGKKPVLSKSAIWREKRAAGGQHQGGFLGDDDGSEHAGERVEVCK
jgi:hypothetical protein